MGLFIYQSRKMGQLYTVSLEKGAYRIPGSAGKGAIRAAHPYHVSYPPPEGTSA